MRFSSHRRPSRRSTWVILLFVFAIVIIVLSQLARRVGDITTTTSSSSWNTALPSSSPMSTIINSRSDSGERAPPPTPSDGFRSVSGSVEPHGLLKAKKTKHATLVNGVILFLAGGRWDSYFTRECLPRLERYVLACFPYPVLVFHENLPLVRQQAIAKAIPTASEVHHNLHFDNVADLWATLPHGIQESTLQKWMTTGLQSKFQGRGYRLMCRFWHGMVWQRSSLQSYQYYWRLDTDSIFSMPLTLDPFLVMQTKQCGYGYNRLKGENPHVAEGLWDNYKQWATQQVQSGRMLPSTLKNVTAFAIDPKTKQFWAPMYYNNFELGTMALKRHPLYRSYFEHVDQHEPFGILRYRWGDAPLHTLGVMTVLAEEWSRRRHNDAEGTKHRTMGEGGGVDEAGWGLCFFAKSEMPYRHAVEKPGPMVHPARCEGSD